MKYVLYKLKDKCLVIEREGSCHPRIFDVNGYTNSYPELWKETVNKGETIHFVRTLEGNYIWNVSKELLQSEVEERGVLW